MSGQRFLAIAAPVLIGLITLGLWEGYVRLNAVPAYVLPAPSAIAQALIKDWGLLWPSLLVTLRVTLMALALATVGGLVLALLFASARWIELSLYPYAIVLQVTPIVAIAPLILIYVPDPLAALLLCAWIVAFFPVLSNTAFGLSATDRGLLDLFRLYKARRWQTLFLLRLPSALPYFLSGVRIAGGLALIGAVVAEFAAGTVGTSSGLAYRILEAGYRLNIPRMFAALFLIAALGIVIFAATALLSRLALRRWHDSQQGR
ncbi:ABC transporter permease [Zavarzinia sp. CC-PAN008]|uniref:ABC transporter permease n=1 Tax=Zavarzinia sp. CC-PAN008 TaxID=3243332 RepID=UPI003F746A9A